MFSSFIPPGGSRTSGLKTPNMLEQRIGLQGLFSVPEPLKNEPKVDIKVKYFDTDTVFSEWQSS